MNNLNLPEKGNFPVEISELIDKFYNSSSVILDRYKNLSKELNEKLFLECFEIRGNVIEISSIDVLPQTVVKS